MSEHQRVSKRGSSDSSRESDKEVADLSVGGGSSWVKKSGSRSGSTSGGGNANLSSNDRTSSLSPLPSTQVGGGSGHVTSRSNQQKVTLSSKLQGENAWNRDMAEEWADEEIDPSVFSECTTDDDKLRNKRKLKAAAVAAQSAMTSSTTSSGMGSVGVVSRPTATTGTPTPSTTTTVSSTATHSWQEVTKTTRWVWSTCYMYSS